MLLFDIKDENNIMAQSQVAIYDKAKKEGLKIARTNLEISRKI
jgi:hypothetical protein